MDPNISVIMRFQCTASQVSASDQIRIAAAHARSFHDFNKNLILELIFSIQVELVQRVPPEPSDCRAAQVRLDLLDLPDHQDWSVRREELERPEQSDHPERLGI